MGISSKDHRGIAEGSPRGRREEILAGMKPLARDNPSRADASVRERDEAVGMADINARPPNEA